MQVTCEIFKGTPGREGTGRFVTYTVEAEPSDMVLDVLETVYHRFDPSLAYRYACGVARCGECGMVINGEPCMACDRPVEPHLHIEPLRHLPAIRDTVIDRRQVFDHIRKNLPPAADVEDVPGKLEALGDAEAKQRIERSIRLTTCFECLICQSVCPRYLTDSDGFPGPLGLLMLAQMEENPAQAAIGGEWRRMLTAACLRCGKCVRHCPASKEPLKLALDLLGCAPRRAVRASFSEAGEVLVQEVPRDA